MPTKPSNLIYGVDEKPPFAVSLLLGFQHLIIIAIGLIFPVVVVRECGGTTEQATRMVAMAMIAAGIGALAQALRKGPVGSGFLCPQVCGPSFLSASILAVKTGGLSLLFGMTLMGGLFEAFLSRFLHRLRALFPAEVTGLIVMMVGITVINIALKNFFGIGDSEAATRPKVVLVSSVTLALMIGLNVWSRGKLKLYCVLIGMVTGYVLSFLTGIMDEESLVLVLSAQVFHFPFLYHPGWSFSFTLLVPALVATFCSTLKSVGDLTTCQKVNDAHWKRPDMQNIRKGILADAVGAVAAGMLGTIGQSTSSSNIGLSIATGATSRVVSFFIAGMLIVSAFIPKISSLLAIMPEPVIGATFTFVLSFMIVVGIQIISTRMMDARKTFVVGASMIFGLSVDIVPQAYLGLHHWIQPIFSSSLSAAMVMAVLLNLVFRIGISKSAQLTLEKGKDVSEAIFTFMDRQGGLWGVRKEIAQKAQGAMNEFAEAAATLGWFEQPILIDARFDEFNLDINLTYTGEPINFPEKAPSQEEMLEDERAAASLSLLLLKRYADRVVVEPTDGRVLVKLHFEH
ncbi:MAG: purine/pyrimidine permease [Deltaproteobacteria bacterium]|nr:purine/pyrimidine permease [Deltaproteobacteria bacterium]